MTRSQSVVPMLSYRDGVAALDWLRDVFGFAEKARFLGEDGLLAHGELVAGSDTIMLATPTPQYEGPALHRSHCKESDDWLSVPWVVDGVLVYVANVDAHCARAIEKGARVLGEIEHGPPGKRYRVEDLEGHRWMFMESPAVLQEAISGGS